MEQKESRNRKRVEWALLVGIPGVFVFLATNKADEVIANLNSWRLLLGATMLSLGCCSFFVVEQKGHERRWLKHFFGGATYTLAVCLVALALKGISLVF